MYTRKSDDNTENFFIELRVQTANHFASTYATHRSLHEARSLTVFNSKTQSRQRNKVTRRKFVVRIALHVEDATSIQPPD